MISNPLIQYGKIVLSHETGPASDVEELICRTVLGSPDGIRYRLLDSKDKIYETKPLHFFPVRKGNSLIYVMALAERITSFKSDKFHSYYVRYVTFNEGFSTSEKKNGFAGSAKKRIGNSFIKEAMRKHAETFAPTLKGTVSDKKKKLYYAYVEESNFRSMDFTAFFFQRIRTFSVLSFSRLFPAKDKRVDLIPDGQTENVSRLISEYYRDHSFFFLQKSKLSENYYVLKENNEIIAGLKVGEANWKIEQLPGMPAKTLLNIVPYIPVFRRLIQQGIFHFLTFDTIFCKPGKGDLLPVLFESVCAIKKVYSALVYIDSDTDLYHELKRIKKLGVLNKFFSEAKGAVLARFVNFTDDEIKTFYSNPAYIWGNDLS